MLVFGFQPVLLEPAMRSPKMRPCSLRRSNHSPPLPQAGTGQLLNSVFTRVVNHCVIVVGLKGSPRPAGTKGQSLFGRYSRVLMSNMRCRLEKNHLPCSILG